MFSTLCPIINFTNFNFLFSPFLFSLLFWNDLSWTNLLVYLFCLWFRQKQPVNGGFQLFILNLVYLVYLALILLKYSRWLYCLFSYTDSIFPFIFQYGLEDKKPYFKAIWVQYLKISYKHPGCLFLIRKLLYSPAQRTKDTVLCTSCSLL